MAETLLNELWIRGQAVLGQDQPALGLA